MSESWLEREGDQLGNRQTSLLFPLEGVKFHSISILPKSSISGFKLNFLDWKQSTRLCNLLTVTLSASLTAGAINLSRGNKCSF